jgi:intracellular septation protein A
MDGGLAVFGFGLFLFAIANLYNRTGDALAWMALALSIGSMGMAFSESRHLRTTSLVLGGVLFVLGLGALVAGLAWWQWLGTVLFGVAYLTLWAEFRYPAFGNVRPEDVPPPHARRRWHLPLRRQRV